MISDARKATKKLWWKNNPDRVKVYKRREQLKKYGLTEDDYDRMLARQKGVCAICKRPPKKYRLAVDHDHTTEEVRGLLCHPCNKGLWFIENAAWLRKATRYLK